MKTGYDLMMSIASGMSWALQHNDGELTEDNITGWCVPEYYNTCCEVWYNGSEDAYVAWAEMAGFDVGPEQQDDWIDQDKWDDFFAYQELACEWIGDIIPTLDFGAIPKEWLVDVLRRYS